MPRVTEDMIRDMASIIARQVSPEAIMLFGSQATDKAGTDSDVDFLVIESTSYGPGNDRRQKMTLLWKALAKYPVSKDILVYGRDEIDRWRDARNHIIAKALKEGRFLYWHLVMRLLTCLLLRTAILAGRDPIGLGYARSMQGLYDSDT